VRDVAIRELRMGYALTSLGNLPVDDEVKFYIFAINGQWQEPLYRMIEQNFESIARSIGKHAVIAKGLNPAEWYGEVAERYLGKDHDRYFQLLPALLVTDTHPDRLSDKSVRLLVPLKDIEDRFGGWTQFFTLLSDFVQLKSDEFAKRFERKEDLLNTATKIINVNPGAFGVSINAIELLSWWRRRARKGPAARPRPVV
jgi:hypothetical protein